MSVLYDNLKTICKEKRTTITALCLEITGSKGNLATWKKGSMTADHLSKCADVLGVSTDFLLGRTPPVAEQLGLNGTAPLVVPTRSAIFEKLRGLSETEYEELNTFIDFLKFKRDHSSAEIG